MPESYEEAVHKGLRGAIVTTLKYGIPALLLIFAILWGLNYIFDWITSPFAAVGNFFSGLWPFGGGEETVTSAPAPDPADDEPGAICSRTGGWNPFC